MLARTSYETAATTAVVLLAAATALLVLAGPATAAADTVVTPGESIQDAVDASAPGDVVAVQEGRYAERVVIDANSTGEPLDGLTLCSTTTGGSSCDPQPDSTTITTLGISEAAVRVAADGVTVQGFTVKVDAQNAVGIDASHASNPSLLENRIEVGIADDTFGPVPQIGPEAEFDYLDDPFVERTVSSGTVDEISADHDDEPGYLGAMAIPEDAEQADVDHVGLFYAGDAPAGVTDEPATDDRPALRVYEDHGEPEPLVEPNLTEEMDRTVLSPSEAANLTPDYYELIRPGALMSFGGAGCTANWVWTNASRSRETLRTDKFYLGSAGHCFVSDGKDTSQDRTSPRLPIDVCIRNCSRARDTATGSTWVRVADEESDVVYAVNRGVGDDFGILEIPDEIRDLVSPELAYWGGVSGPSSVQAGDIATHFGHGVGSGDTFLTHARAGVHTIQPSHDDALAFVTHSSFGDSGSAIALGVANASEGLQGARATGLLTHLCIRPFFGVVYGPATTCGTTVSRAKELVDNRLDSDLTIRVVRQNETLLPPFRGPPLPPENVAVDDVSTAAELRLEVAWERADGSPEVVEYGVYRNTSSGTYEKVASTEDTSFLDTSATLEPGVEYCYKIDASNPEGTSDLSAKACSTPTFPDIAAPSFADAVDRERADSISLRWAPPDTVSDFDGFRIERYDGSDLEATFEVGPGTESLVDDGLEEGNTYTYSVRVVVDGDVGEAASATVTPTRNRAVWPEASRDSSAFTGATGDISIPRVVDSTDVGGPISASPVVADLDKDGRNEIVVTHDTGEEIATVDVVAYEMTADGLEQEWRHSVGPVLGAADGWGKAAVADLDGDGAPEVAATTYFETDGLFLSRLYALDGATGSVVNVTEDMNPLHKAPLRVVDLGAPGEHVLVLEDNIFINTHDTRLNAWTLESDGSFVKDVDTQVGSDVPQAGPATFETGDGGAPTLFVTTGNREAGGTLTQGRDVLHRCDFQTASTTGGISTTCGPIAKPSFFSQGLSVGYADGVEPPHVAVHSDRSLDLVNAATGERDRLGDRPEQSYNKPVLVDVNRDGTADVTSAAYDAFLGGVQAGDVYSHAFDDGSYTLLGLAARPPSTASSSGVPGGPVVADVDGDGSLEAIVGDESGVVAAVSMDEMIDGQSRPFVWQTSIDQGVRAPLAVADVTREGSVEVVVAGEDGQLAVVDSAVPGPVSRTGMDLSGSSDADVAGTTVTAHGGPGPTYGALAASGAPSTSISDTQVEATASNAHQRIVGIRLSPGSNDSTVAGTTIALDGANRDPLSTDGATVTGVRTGAEGIAIRDSTIALDGGGCSPQDLASTQTCREGTRSIGVDFAGGAHDAEISGTTIQASAVGSHDASVGGFQGVRGAPPGSVLSGNTFRYWAGAAVYPSNPNVTVTRSDFFFNEEGIRLDRGSDGVTVERTSFGSNNVAVALNGDGDGGVSGPEDVTIRIVRFDGTNNAPLELEPGTQNLTVDARQNAWLPVTEHQLLDTRVRDRGEDNEVLQIPFATTEGIEPGLVRVRTDAGVTDERFLSVQAAIDAASAGDTVLLPGSDDTENPTPYPEAVTVDKPLTICGSADGKTCGADADQVVLDATGEAATAVDVNADGTVLQHLSVRHAGAVDAPVTGVDLSDAADTRLADAAVQVAGGDCTADEIASGDCAAFSDAVGVDTMGEGNATLVDVRVSADLPHPEDGAHGGRAGIVADKGTTIRGADLAWWKNGIKLDSPPGTTPAQDVTVRSSSVQHALKGVQVRCDVTDSLVNGTTFRGTAMALNVCGGGNEFHSNNVDLSNGEGLVLTPASSGLEVDATCNDWGVYTDEAVQGRILDRGSDNNVTYRPFSDPRAVGLRCVDTPTAAFNAPDTVTRIEDANLDDQSMAGDRPIVEHRWDFGDGDGTTTVVRQEIVNVTHRYDRVGTFEATLTIRDTTGLTDVASKTITVENLAPELEPVGPVDVLHDTRKVVQVNASDPESDTMELRIAEDHEWLTKEKVAAGTWNLTLTPGAPEIGLHALTLTVTDAPDPAVPQDRAGTDSLGTSIDVLNPSPEWTVFPTPPPVEVGDTQTVDVRAEDRDEPVDLSSPESLENVTFTDEGDGNGTVTFAPGHAGETHTISLEATDDHGATTIRKMTLRAGAVPVLVDVPTTAVGIAGDVLTVSVEVDDPDTPDASVAISAQDDPIGASFTDRGDGTGTWSWPIPEDALQDDQVTFVADDRNFTSSFTMEVVVRQRPEAQVLPARVDGTGTLSETVLPGEDAILRAGTNDEDGVVVDGSYELATGHQVPATLTPDGRLLSQPVRVSRLAPAPSLLLPLDEAQDGSVDLGNAANASLSGACGTGCPTATAGTFGSAASFDGSDDAVTVGTTEALDVGRNESYTLSAWVKTSSSGFAVAGKMDPDNGYRGFDLFVHDGHVRAHLIHAWSGDALAVDSVPTIDDGEWHQVVVTYDGSREASGMTLYVDGQAVPTTVVEDSLSGSTRTTAPFQVGARDGEQHFQGVVDEVLFADRVLPAETIAERFQRSDVPTARAYPGLGNLTAAAVPVDDTGIAGPTPFSLSVSANEAPTVETPEQVVVQGLTKVRLDASNSSDPEGRPVAVTWTLPDGSTVENTEAVFQPSALGTYEATVAVADNLGAANTTTVQIVVDDRLFATPTLSPGPDDDPGSVGVDERPLASVMVQSTFGSPTQGADVTFDVVHDATGQVVSSVSATTDDEGVAFARLPYDVQDEITGEGKNLLGDHTLRATAAYPDQVPGPDAEDGNETVTETFGYAVE